MTPEAVVGRSCFFNDLALIGKVGTMRKRWCDIQHAQAKKQRHPKPGLNRSSHVYISCYDLMPRLFIPSAAIAWAQQILSEVQNPSRKSIAPSAPPETAGLPASRAAAGIH